jgi:hypothetical protein
MYVLLRAAKKMAGQQQNFHNCPFAKPSNALSIGGTITFPRNPFFIFRFLLQPEEIDWPRPSTLWHPVGGQQAYYVADQMLSFQNIKTN